MKTKKLVNCPQCGGFGFTSTHVSADYKIAVCRAKTCELCHGAGVIEAPRTNADRIRAMSDEELAEFLTHMNPTNCQDCAFSHGWRCQPDRDDYSSFEKCKEGRKKWLQQPADGEEDKNDV